MMNNSRTNPQNNSRVLKYIYDVTDSNTIDARGQCCCICIRANRLRFLTHYLELQVRKVHSFLKMLEFTTEDYSASIDSGRELTEHASLSFLFFFLVQQIVLSATKINILQPTLNSVQETSVKLCPDFSKVAAIYISVVTLLYTL